MGKGQLHTTADSPPPQKESHIPSDHDAGWAPPSSPNNSVALPGIKPRFPGCPVGNRSITSPDTVRPGGWGEVAPGGRV